MTSHDLRTLRAVIEANPAGAIINLPASAVLALLDMVDGRRPIPQEADNAR